MMAAPVTNSGKIITAWNVASIPDVWRSINHIANKLAVLDLMAYQDSPSGGCKPLKKHNAYKLLKRMPNDEMTPFVFKKVVETQALIWGNGYAYLPRDEFGRATEMLPLDPSCTYRERVNGLDVYKTIIDKEPMHLLAENVLHIMSGLSFDGMMGKDITKVLGESLGISAAIQTYQAVYFANNGMPSLILELPPDMSSPEKVEKFRKTWGDIHQGLSNAHRVALMTNGAKFAAQINKDNVGGDVAKLSEQQTRAIAKIFGIPSSFYGLADSYTSHNSLESQSKQFLADTMEPHLVMWEQAAERKLLTRAEFDSESVFIAFDRSKLIELDAKTKEDINNQRLANNQISFEEWRATNNMPTTVTGHFFRPANINLVDENFLPVLPEPPEPENTEKPADEQKEESQVEDKPSGEPQNDQRIVSLTNLTVKRLIERVKKSVENKRFDESEHRHVFDDHLAAFGKDATLATDGFFSSISSELEAISSGDLHQIQWDQYQKTIISKLLGA